MQRIRVAMTGLAAVVLLIGVASAVFNYASDEPPVTAIGAAKPDVVANMTAPPIANTTTNEPLAELGVAPVAVATGDANAAEAQPK